MQLFSYIQLGGCSNNKRSMQIDLEYSISQAKGSLGLDWRIINVFYTFAQMGPGWPLKCFWALSFSFPAARCKYVGASNKQKLHLTSKGFIHFELWFSLWAIINKYRRRSSYTAMCFCMFVLEFLCEAFLQCGRDISKQANQPLQFSPLCYTMCDLKLLLNTII